MAEAPPTEEKPWETDQEVWESGYAMLLKLRNLRGIGLFSDKVNPALAEAEIAEFCRHLRRSPHLALPRLQREFRLTNDGVVCVLAVFMAYMQLSVTNRCDICEVGLLACGISPCRLQKLRMAIERNEGLGLLVTYDSCWRLSETSLLRGQIFGQPISAMEARTMKAQIEKLPVTKRQGIPDNRGDDGPLLF
jgi:hypothetical protein